MNEVLSMRLHATSSPPSYLGSILSPLIMMVKSYSGDSMEPKYEGGDEDAYKRQQWTSAIDLTNRKVYYKKAYNNNIRCINMKKIDFDKVKYQSYPLDKELKQPIEEIIVK